MGRRWIGIGGLLAVLVAVPEPAAAAERTLRIDAARSEVTFDLGATLHTVHGRFAVAAGELRFDADAGTVSGALRVSATSGDTGNQRRDRKMHRDILESERFPQIVFTPRSFVGELVLGGTSVIQVAGRMELHGSAHDLTLPVEVTLSGETLKLVSSFDVPFVEWGLEDPSSFVLRVAKSVQVRVELHGAASN